MLAPIVGNGQDSYNIHIDLSQSSEDQVPVTVTVPAVSQDQVEYHMPKIDIPQHIQDRAQGDYDKQTYLYLVELCQI